MSSGVRTLGVTPMYHITGYHCVFWYTILLNGTYYVPKARDTESMLEQIQEEKLTYVAAAPIVLDRMVDVARQKTFDLSSVDTVVPGSAPKPPMLMEDLREVFPSALFGEAYGTSEGVMLGAVDLFEKPGAFQVIGDMTARVVKPAANQTTSWTTKSRVSSLSRWIHCESCTNTGSCRTRPRSGFAMVGRTRATPRIGMRREISSFMAASTTSFSVGREPPAGRDRNHPARASRHRRLRSDRHA